jgi:Protein of unknown function (DUF5818)
MKKFLGRVFLAAAVVAAGTALGTLAHAQQPGSQDPAATAPPQQQAPAGAQDPAQTPSATPQEPAAGTATDPAATAQQNEPQMPAAGADVKTQDAQAFTGKIVKQSGRIVLMDPVTKTTYRIDDASKVKVYMGKEVKVTGTLDTTSNTIRVTGIETVSTD